MKAIITRERDHASIASFIHTMISMCNNAAVNGHEVYVDWTGQPAYLYADDNGGLCPNVWDWYCEQPMLKEKPQGAEIWTWENGTSQNSAWRYHCPIFGDLPWNAQSEFAVRELQRIVPKFLRFKPVVSELGETLFKLHELDPHATIGVCHRGTDKGRESPIIPADAYFPGIDRILTDHPTWKLWVKAEEERVNDQFKRRYRNAIIMPHFFSTVDPLLVAEKCSPNSGYEKGLDAVTLIYMFSRCAKLLRNAGNLGDLAAALQPQQPLA